RSLSDLNNLRTAVRGISDFVRISQRWYWRSVYPKMWLINEFKLRFNFKALANNCVGLCTNKNYVECDQSSNRFSYDRHHNHPKLIGKGKHGNKTNARASATTSASLRSASRGETPPGARLVSTTLQGRNIRGGDEVNDAGHGLERLYWNGNRLLGTSLRVT